MAAAAPDAGILLSDLFSARCGKSLKVFSFSNTYRLIISDY
jgi:hypothetical protein